MPPLQPQPLCCFLISQPLVYDNDDTQNDKATLADIVVKSIVYCFQHNNYCLSLFVDKWLPQHKFQMSM